MFATNAVHVASAAGAARALYDAVGDFLEANRLAFDPVNYAFAYRVLSQPASPLARTVAALTDGGIRLTVRDIEALGADVAAAKPSADDATTAASHLVARTQFQVEGFADMMDAMRAETRGFGRDLAASADAIRLGERDNGEVVRLTQAMLDRVATAEGRLEVATREASTLRAQLEEARGDARRDPLTGRPNRRAVVEAFAAGAGAATPLCLAICDIDHFKRVNDRFGHAVGDRVLKAIGDALALGCDGQLVSRYGGEEFAILFSGTTPAAALAMLDATRLAIAAKRYRLKDTDAPLGSVTISAGLVAVAPDEGFADAFRRADDRLYAAKIGGRDRVVA